MTVRELVAALDLEVLTGDINLDRQIGSGYTSDLLSDVIANIGDDAVWITIQRHINILGVAKLKDVAAIIIPRNLGLEEAFVAKAKEEGIAVLKGKPTAFELSAFIYNALKRGQGVA
ncbi:MAG: putative thiamine biosynthesis protein ThiC [Deltaproteobacteria bacterium]|nr:putative thiamine biosynthesis protein ThiC [Deltaproteobacteria bacterium]